MRMGQAWRGDGGRWLLPAALLCSFFLREVAAQTPAPAVLLTLDSPLQWQVFQRHSPRAGRVEVRGRALQADQVEARWVGTAQAAPEWQRVPLAADGTFAATLEVPAGGWYRCEVRALLGGQRLAEAAVGQVGVGEVFVVAGQSNSANYGEQKLQPASGRVAAGNGQSWREAKGGAVCLRWEMRFRPGLACRSDLLPVASAPPACGNGFRSELRFRIRPHSLAAFDNSPTAAGKAMGRPFACSWKE